VEIGFYWVKTPEEYDGLSKWEIAFYNGKEWELCGEEWSFDSDYFVDIKKEPLEPPK